MKSGVAIGALNKNDKQYIFIRRIGVVSRKYANWQLAQSRNVAWHIGNYRRAASNAVYELLSKVRQV